MIDPREEKVAIIKAKLGVLKEEDSILLSSPDSWWRGALTPEAYARHKQICEAKKELLSSWKNMYPEWCWD